MLLTRSLELFADYHQFYVLDSGVGQPPEDYTDDDVQRRVKIAPSVLAVLAARNTTIPLLVEVHENDPGTSLDDWDHIVECSLELPTGRLQVRECSGAAVLDLQVTPGAYHARVLFAGLGDVSEDGLTGNDRYAVMLWSGAFRAVRVVRQWQGAG